MNEAVTKLTRAIITFVILIVLLIAYVAAVNYSQRKSLIKANRAQCVSGSLIQSADVNNLELDVANLQADIAQLRTAATANGLSGAGQAQTTQKLHQARKAESRADDAAVRAKQKSIRAKLAEIAARDQRIDPSAMSTLESQADRTKAARSGFSCAKRFPLKGLLDLAVIN